MDDRELQLARNREIVERKIAATPLLVSPSGGVYKTGDMELGELGEDHDSGLAYYGNGRPAVPESESELSRWLLMQKPGPPASVNGIWTDSDGIQEGEFFKGEISLILTDRAVRAASRVGDVHGYGQLSVWACFAFVVPLSEIDWVVGSKRAVVFGCDNPTTIISVKDAAAAESDWDWRASFKSQNPLFANELTMAIARAQADHEDAGRAQRATEILRMGVGALPFNRMGRGNEVRFRDEPGKT